MEQPPSTARYEREFHALGPDEFGRIAGQKLKPVLEGSKLNNAMLHKIWTLSDIDEDGKLTLYEFALCKHFIEMKLNGLDLPVSLPEHFVPISMVDVEEELQLEKEKETLRTQKKKVESLENKKAATLSVEDWSHGIGLIIM